MMQKVLITGSNGLLGQKLLRLFLQSDDFQIIGTSKGKNRITTVQEFEYKSLDICDSEEVEKIVAEIKPNFIINTAAMTNVDQCEEEKNECWNVNVNGVKNLECSANAHGAFLLHLSTDFIFDGQNGPYDEEAEGNPLSYYGKSKLASENILLNSKANAAIVRTVLVYGITENMSRSNLILWVKNSLQKGEKIKVVNDQWRTPTLVEDLATGCSLIIKNQLKGIFNISGGEMLTPYEMALQTANHFDLDQSLIEKTNRFQFKEKVERPLKTGLIISKAKRLLKYNPHTFKEGICILEDQITTRTTSI